MIAPVHRLKALGGLSIYQTGTDTAVTSIQGRRLALLAFLARGTAGVRRETLAGHLWPDSDMDRARNALNQAVLRCDATSARTPSSCPAARFA
jgi:DNA-binding SARP family transcriptional activator